MVSMKTYVVVLIRSASRGTSNEDHNICFCEEIRKISIHFFLSETMADMQNDVNLHNLNMYGYAG